MRLVGRAGQSTASDRSAPESVRLCEPWATSFLGTLNPEPTGLGSKIREVQSKMGCGGIGTLALSFCSRIGFGKELVSTSSHDASRMRRSGTVIDYPGRKAATGPSRLRRMSATPRTATATG